MEVVRPAAGHQRPGSARGFVFLVQEDEFGLVNLVIKPALHERQRSLVRKEPFVIVRGELQRRDGTVTVVAERFEPLRSTGEARPCRTALVSSTDDLRLVQARAPVRGRQAVPVGGEHSCVL